MASTVAVTSSFFVFFFCRCSFFFLLFVSFFIFGQELCWKFFLNNLHKQLRSAAAEIWRAAV